ncbi:ArnT family glycosyltransferase [Croceicoccus pelagius]|uniref:Glycosyltransferase RgtA/B/C/D-like domain-containing protein n=1 Tax=Croceicoccus pelagius TaxID=1703341 RepID=A0A916YL06_9SPHN|nr:glycosyltransferase family 39 protein [Croceicoccus pelagius]GGD50481.1 hypothetical protein GCM10010989_25840 [Croceicoccus pelagius]
MRENGVERTGGLRAFIGPQADRGLARVALVAILVAAFLLRLDSIRFGLPAMLDPDELIFELGGYRMISSGTLNPGWFGHPATITMYVLAIVDVLVFAVGWIGGHFASPAQFGDAIYSDPGMIVLPGRIVMALFGVACVWLTHKLAHPLFDRPVALIAAALVAVSPVHVGLSQIIRSDMMATCFLLAALICAVDIMRDGNRGSYVLGALFVALATTTKWPFALAFLAIAAAIGMRAAKGEIGLGTALVRVVVVSVLSVVFAVLLSPYLVLDWQTLVSNLEGEAQKHHIGATGGTWLQNLAFYASGPLWRSLGPVALALAAIGLFTRSSRREFLPLAGPVAVGFLVAFAVQTLVWERWILPFIPLVAIAAALGLQAAWRMVGHGLKPKVAAGLAGIVGFAMILPPMMETSADTAERKADTRVIATNWLKANAAPDASILVEHFAFDLAPTDHRVLFPLAEAGCLDARDILSGKIQYDEVDAVRGGNSNLDYAAIPADMRETCRADYAVLTQFSRYRAEADRYPEKWAAYRDLIASGRVVARVRPVRGKIGGYEAVVVDLR